MGSPNVVAAPAVVVVVVTILVMIVGWKCVVCATTVGVDEALVFTCPRRTPDDPFHVLHPMVVGDEPAPVEDDHPLVRYGDRMAWRAFAAAHDVSASELDALAKSVVPDAAVTPFERSTVLSDHLGVEVWVKDETNNVAGSHKARHLVGILAHLLVAERLGHLPERPPLAIASCGNAALAAATLAVRVDWPIDVYVPTWMDPAFGDRLTSLGARIHRCERRPDDPAGDPAMLRFREAVARGAVPFTVQGPENALCLDTGRTIGWEVAEQAEAAGVRLERAFVQVGGGAFAGCFGAGVGPDVPVDLVQTEGCAPLAAAWERARDIARPELSWPQVMQPWPNPHSAADGILDDETYDWLADFDVMRRSGGRPIVVPETSVLEAHRLATEAGFRVSVTGSAGLAGALDRSESAVPGTAIAVVMSGVGRS